MDEMSFCILVLSYVRGSCRRWGRQSFPVYAYGNLGMRQCLSPTSSLFPTINTTMQAASRLFPDWANPQIWLYLDVKWSCSISSSSGPVSRGDLSYLGETSHLFSWIFQSLSAVAVSHLCTAHFHVCLAFFTATLAIKMKFRSECWPSVSKTALLESMNISHLRILRGPPAKSESWNGCQ